MEHPLRIFVGSSPRHMVEEKVMVSSLLRRATRPLVIDVIDAGEHSVRRVPTGETWALPDAWRGHVGGNKSFTFARFGAPELCGYEGRAIYCESDQIALADIAELWDFPLGGADLAAVPYEAARGRRPRYQTGGHLSSVMVFDAARCRSLSLPAVSQDVRAGRVTYEEMISVDDSFLDRLGLRIAPLHPRWNDLEHRFGDTAILHFTHSKNPWLHPGQPEGAVWTREYLTCVADGMLDQQTLDSVRHLGGVSARTRALARLPRRAVPVVDVAWQSGEQLRDRGAELVQPARRKIRRAPAGLRRRASRAVERVRE